ncbi:MAG: thioredoxin domain-containing protein [Halobacteriota archaeon]
MDDPTARNRLASAGSPYLEQHADNPVNWQPWDEAALLGAEARDVPIFLSIGYSACHWCHVMAEESFEDRAVADRLNESFVPIKVDREERPDLDSIYQTICQLVAGGGGWPLSVWLTPSGKPFYVGTYFPKEPRRGQPGFIQLLEDIANSWSDPTQRSEIEARAEQWTDAIVDRVESTPDVPDGIEREPPGSDLFGEAVRAARRGADREFGGFGTSGPKFPQARRIELLLSAATRGEDDALAVAVESLDAMASGGMYDHVGGGFHRYAVDREWTVPHFEKMLYDNAELPRIYLRAYQYTGDGRYADVAAETLSFVERELRAPDGGFYSTLDAQSDGQEGAFYVWTPEEIEAVLSDADAALVCDRYGVTDGGNFEGGTTVLTVSRSIESLAAAYDAPESAIESRLADATAALFAARSDRDRPARDEKILAGWNGLAISAFADAGVVLSSSYAETAADALAAIRDELWDGERMRLSRRVIDGAVAGEGYLEDYAFLARGAFDLYQATGDVEPLAFALQLAAVLLEEFYDSDRETLYFTPEGGESLVARPQEFYDQSTPSSLGVATRLLIQLDGFRTDRRFAETARSVLETHADRIRSSPLEHVSLTLATLEHERGPTELTIAADELPTAWRETLAERYIPGALLAHRPPTDGALSEWLDRLGVDEVPPIWAGRTAEEGHPTVYACQSRTCSPPQTDLQSALAWLSGDRS